MVTTENNVFNFYHNGQHIEIHQLKKQREKKTKIDKQTYTNRFKFFLREKSNSKIDMLICDRFGKKEGGKTWTEK